jgi:hypothetical protein
VQVLTHGYNKIDPQLVAPELRSDVEKQLALIAKGEVEFDVVLRYVLDIFAAKYQYFVAKIEKMNQLFEANFLSIEEVPHRFLFFFSSSLCCCCCCFGSRRVLIRFVSQSHHLFFFEKNCSRWGGTCRGVASV